MKEFFIYFFGEGTTPEFALFTPAHLMPILLLITLLALVFLFRKRIRSSRHEENLRFVLAFALIISDMSYYWRLVGMPSLHPGPVENLPIGVCGWALTLLHPAAKTDRTAGSPMRTVHSPGRISSTITA